MVQYQLVPGLLHLYLVCATCSLIFQVAVLLMFILKKYHKNEALLMVAYLTISNFILSLGYVFSFSRLGNYGKIPSNQPVCVVQSIFINFGQLSTLIWSSIISYVLLKSFYTSETSTQAQMLVFLGAGFGIPLIMTIFPFAFGVNGDSGYYCWLDVFADKTLNMIFANLEFTVPALICIGYNVIVVIIVLVKIRELEAESSLDLKRLLLYPCVAVICWVFRFTIRIYIFSDDTIPPVSLIYFSLVSSALLGAVNSLVYASSMTFSNCWRSGKGLLEDQKIPAQLDQTNGIEMARLDSIRQRRQTFPKTRTQFQENSPNPRYRVYSITHFKT